MREAVRRASDLEALRSKGLEKERAPSKRSEIAGEKEQLSQAPLQQNFLKIGERTLGNILQQVEKSTQKPPIDTVEESLPEEYDGKIRSGAIFSIGEKMVRQIHEADSSLKVGLRR